MSSKGTRSSSSKSGKSKSKSISRHLSKISTIGKSKSKSRTKTGISKGDGGETIARINKDGKDISVIFNEEAKALYRKWKIRTFAKVVCQCVVVFLPIVFTFYYTTYFLFEYDKFSFDSKQDSIRERIERKVNSYFHDKTYIVKKLKNDLEIGDYDEIWDVNVFEEFVSSVFRKDEQLYAMYQSNSNRRTWKIHRENPGYLSTQIRVYINSSYTYRFERRRYLNESMGEYFVTPNLVKIYEPFKKGWYKDGNESFPNHVWIGPEYVASESQSSEVKDVPIMVYVQKVVWKNKSRTCTYKLKIQIQSINEFVANEENDYLKIIGINDDYTVVSYRDITKQLNGDKTAFRKIWEIEDDNLNLSKEKVDKIKSEKNDGGTAGIFSSKIDYSTVRFDDIGWTFIFSIDKEKYQSDIYVKQYVSISLVIVGMTLLIIVMVIVMYLFVRMIVHGVKASKAIFVTETISKIQNEKIQKYNQLDDIDILLDEQAAEKKSGNVAKLRINKKLFEVKYEDIQIEKEVGAGGSGAKIYKSTWKEKVFKTKDLSEQNVIDDFEKEINLMSSLRFVNGFFNADFYKRHPNILEFYGCSLREPRVGILLEYCGFQDVKKYCLKHGQDLNFIRKLKILKGTASAVEFLHSKSIIHRDLKWQNVLLKADYTPKLADFGLSRIIEENQMELTRKIGTAYYMAPEITMKTDYNSAVDVFSFGIMMSEMLTLVKE